MVLDLKTAVEVQDRSTKADKFTAEILAELMKQVQDMLARIITEKGGVDVIQNITTGQLT